MSSTLINEALAGRASGLLKLSLNGTAIELSADPMQRTSDLLRSQGYLATKVGCDAGDCGACTILIDGAPACACLVPAAQIDGCRVETAEGKTKTLEALRAAFLQTGAAQCGICTPGMLMSAVALIEAGGDVTRTGIENALGGVLCRCTGYAKIIDAVMLAAHADVSKNVGKPSDSVAAHAAIGARVIRMDGLAKVDGSEIFGADAIPDNALRLRMIRSPYHCADFTLGDTKAWVANTPGMKLVISHEDVKGDNAFGVIPGFTDQPVFAVNRANFRGEAVAAVIGEADAVAHFDIENFPISWSKREAVTDITTALASAPLLEGRKNNVLIEGFVKRGDVEQALSEASHQLTGTFKTQHVEHAYIEPEAGCAERVGNRIELRTCTQTAVMTQESIAEIMGFEKDRVRVVPTAVGGGFGSKLDLSIQPALCIAAWLLDRPVGGVYQRKESMQSTTKRHPSDMQVTVACDNNGKLTAVDFFGVFNTGCYASWGPTVANRVPVHASGPYYVPDYKAHSKAVTTNVVPAGAFRGFGVPQAAFALESMLDRLANKTATDRLQFRINNALLNNQPTVTGQVFSQGVGIKECLEALIPAWQAANKKVADHNARDNHVKLGAGVATCWYGCGNTSLPNPSTIRIGINVDGELILHQGAIDLGQGANTVMAQIAADTLGVSLSQVTLLGADTDITPDAGKTSASRQTFVTGNATLAAASALRQQLLRCVNASEDSTLELQAGVVKISDANTEHKINLTEHDRGNDYVFESQETYNPPVSALDENGQGTPYAQYGYGAQVVELSVDTQLGTVKIQKITTAHDVGCAINPQLIEGQIEGGATQGIGMALMEEFIPGVVENLHDYLIPTIGDIPDFEHHIIEVPDACGPRGAKGLGEHVLIPTAPAIINAITHATGAEINQLPATPDRVLAAIKIAQVD